MHELARRARITRYAGLEIFGLDSLAAEDATPPEDVGAQAGSRARP